MSEQKENAPSGQAERIDKVKSKESFVPLTVRLSEDIHGYLKSESARLGVSINALINILVDDGRRMKEGTLFLSTSIAAVDKSGNGLTVY